MATDAPAGRGRRIARAPRGARHAVGIHHPAGRGEDGAGAASMPGEAGEDDVGAGVDDGAVEGDVGVDARRSVG
jgi:hypothetical protein